jgi:hypothetical protein
LAEAANISHAPRTGRETVVGNRVELIEFMANEALAVSTGRTQRKSPLAHRTKGLEDPGAGNGNRTRDPQLGKAQEGSTVTRAYGSCLAGSCTERHRAAPATSLDAQASLCVASVEAHRGTTALRRPSLSSSVPAPLVTPRPFAAELIEAP